MIKLAASDLETTKKFLATRALYIIDSAYDNALSVMDKIECPEVFFRTDHRVLEAVLYLASVGLDSECLPEIEVEHRFTAIEWESILIHAIGVNLLSITKEIRNGK